MSYNYTMAGIVNAADVPGEFKCRTCQIMWSSYMENNIMHRHNNKIGLHNFDFANPVLVEKIGS
jgi:hypothetical protein